MNAQSSQGEVVPTSLGDLLELYLSLSGKQRELRFTDTARAAQVTGVSVRTIQFWIESGMIQAIVIGRKYQVDLDSLRAYLKRQMERKVR